MNISLKCNAQYYALPDDEDRPLYLDRKSAPILGLLTADKINSSVNLRLSLMFNILVPNVLIEFPFAADKTETESFRIFR